MHPGYHDPPSEESVLKVQEFKQKLKEELQVFDEIDKKRRKKMKKMTQVSEKSMMGFKGSVKANPEDVAHLQPEPWLNDTRDAKQYEDGNI